MYITTINLFLKYTHDILFTVELLTSSMSSTKLPLITRNFHFLHCKNSPAKPSKTVKIDSSIVLVVHSHAPTVQ